MMLLFKMGIKNLSRKKSRSLLTLSAVVLCSMGIMVFSVFMEGMIGMMMDGLVNQIGHHRIVHKKIIEASRLNRGKYFVGDSKAVLRTLRKIPGVRAVSPRIEVGAFIDNNGKQAPSAGLGIDPVVEASVMKLDKKLLKGGRMIRGKGKEIVLGWRLAQRLKAKVGSSLTLIGKTIDDSMSALKLKVVGITNTGTATVDKMFFINIEQAQYFLDLNNQVSFILVFAKNRQVSDALTPAMKKVKMPAGIVSQSWRDSQFGKMLGPAFVFMYILGAFVVFIGGVGLMNTMTMSVLERRGEVGVMMALGFTPKKVAGVFLTEGFVLGTIGALLGVTLAALASIPLVTTGLSFGTDAVSKLPFPIQTTVKGQITTASIVIGFLVGILATLFGTLWPAIQASRMDPVDALRD